MHSEKLEKARAYEKREAARVPEFQRPAFHMSVPIGWMNDPNGFSFIKGITTCFSSTILTEPTGIPCTGAMCGRKIW